MKSKILRRGIALLLSLMTAISIMSAPLTVSARYTDEDIENKISYHELNCREDDCDCLEPENNKFAVVSPVGGNTTYNNYILVDTYQNVQKYFDEQGWTDGLPIVPPTWIKAEKFMRYTPLSDNDIVATVNGRSITAYQVAVNAIMSGCSAEYLPICIAFVEALGDTNYLNSLKSGELTPMMYVNGPIARQLGVDNAQGMTTEECNIAIARFMELALINLAGIERTNAFGNVQPLVFSEDEQNCINIGWDPHHVEEGFELNDNVITATSFAMWGNNITPATDLSEEIMKVIAWDITEKNLGGLGSKSSDENADAHRLIFITPSVASALAKKYQSKDALENALIEHARRPLWMRTYAYFYANVGANLIGSKSFSDVYDELKENSLEDAKTTASPSWMNGITYANIDTVATMTKGNTDIIIQGDESRNKTQVMPGGVSVSKEIQLDDNWDELLASMVISIVYQPLSAHYITPVDNSVKLPSSDGIPEVLHVTKQTTYTVAANASYAKSQNRIYYDAASSTLYYGDGTTAHSVVLDTEKYADFIALVESIGRNGTIRLNNRNAINAVKAVFKTNANFPDQNLVNYTDDAFGSVPLTVGYTSSTNTASLDGAFVTMSADLTKFTADLGGDIVMGDTTDDGFVTVSGTTVTVDASVKAGATAVIGTADGSGTYRTMTIVNGGDGTYKITYNTANTLTLTSSSYYLKGTFNNWEATDAFVKTDNDDILTVIKDIPAGTYTFKVHNAGTDDWHGNGGTINDTANRWTMDSSSDCTFKATGGTYEFKYEISTNKLSVYTAQTDAVATPTTKTVYVGVIEYIKDFVPTLHYWNNSTGLSGDATLTATGETVQYSVGSSYWSGAKQNFKVYKTEIPVGATDMKTWDKGTNGKWADESVTYKEDQILLLFEYSNVYHNVKAEYTGPAVTYTVTFKNWDGTVLSTQQVKEGEAAKAPSTPTKASTAQYTYTFSGWDKEFTNITSDLTVTAQFTEAIRTYTVTFKNYDNKTIVTRTVEYGADAEAPEAPTREADAQYTYTFSGWDKEFTNVTGNLTVTALYSQTINKYTVTFKDYDGTVLDTQTVEYGKGATAPEDPTRPDDELYTYTFAGWDKTFTSIKADTVVTAKYTSELINPTEPTTEAPKTKTVYVGVIEYIKDFVPTLHYWNNSGLEGDAKLTATGETVEYSVGSSYWSGAKQNFTVYKTEIPSEATFMKTFKADGNTNWASETVTYAEDQILLLFEYSNVYHNVTGSYTVEIPTEEPTETTTETPTETSTETPTTGKEFEFVINVTAPKNVEAGKSATVRATAESTSTVTYELYTNTDELVDSNDSGVFSIETSEEQIGKSFTYYVKATTVVDGETYTVTSEKVIYTVIEYRDYWTVEVYFKSANTLGYRPLLTTTGALEELADYEMTKSQFLGTNSTGTGFYYWYKAEVKVSKASPDVSFRILSSRYAMEGNITVTITDDYTTLYLGVDDLNAGMEVVDLTNCTPAERNWYSSAVHMVYDASVDGELNTSAATMSLRNVGDANDDGNINIKDTTLIQKHLANLTNMDAVSANVSDFDNDYKLTIKDATAIQKKIAGLI